MHPGSGHQEAQTQGTENQDAMWVRLQGHGHMWSRVWNPHGHPQGQDPGLH